MKALFVSPHLDDVAFSCGGTLMRLVAEGWTVSLCTMFAESVIKPKGFALACQLDKGLSKDVDYMALRRAEDFRFAAFADVSECLHLRFKEAPNRGYESVAELFAGMHADDCIWMQLAYELSKIAERFTWVFAPQGLGNHVDHLQTILAVQEAGLAEQTVWYRDTPYAIRDYNCKPASLLAHELQAMEIGIDVQRKIAGCAMYETQVPFQFGPAVSMSEKLERFHRADSGYTESFLRSTEANTSPFQSRTMILGI